MKEDVEIVPEGNGTFVARLSWAGVLVEKQLPRGFETWELPEQQAHMKRFIVPRFKHLMSRARRGHALVEIEGETIVQPETDRRRLEAAQLKRVRKAAKLKRQCN